EVKNCCPRKVAGRALPPHPRPAPARSGAAGRRVFRLLEKPGKMGKTQLTKFLSPDKLSLYPDFFKFAFGGIALPRQDLSTILDQFLLKRALSQFVALGSNLRSLLLAQFTE